MILDENLFEDKEIKLDATGRRRPVSYNKRTNKKPVSVEVYDTLTDLGYDVHASMDEFAYELSSRDVNRFERAKKYLSSKGIPFHIKPYGKRYYMTILIPDEGEAVNDYFKSTDKLMVANESLNEDLESPEEMLRYLREYPTYNGQYTRPCKIYDLGLDDKQTYKFGELLNEVGLDAFWKANDMLAHGIYQEGRGGGHLVLDDTVLNLNGSIRSASDIEEAFDNYLSYYGWDLDYDDIDSDDLELLRVSFSNLLAADYNTLKDFDIRVDQLMDNLRAYLDGLEDPEGMDESLEGDKTMNDLIQSKNDNFEKDKEALRQSTVELAKNGIDATDNLKEDVAEKPYTESLLAALKEGKVSYEKVATAALAYLSEDQIKDMCESGLLESLKENLNEDVNSINTNPGLASVVNNLIKDEWEAVQGYNDAITNFESEGHDGEVKVLQDILAEENIHIGQLETILKQVDGSAVNIESGEQEAEEQLTSESQVPTEEPVVAEVTIEAPVEEQPNEIN